MQKKSTKAGTAKKTSARKKSVAKKPVAKKTAASKKPTRKAAVKKTSAKKKPSAAKTAKMEKFREILLVARERITQQVNTLKDESLKRDDEVNPVEDGTDAFDRQFGLLLASSENEALFDINEALRRIEEGTYGACEACGKKIESARLKALPFARKCIKCKSEEERSKAGYRRPPMLERF